jgi:hypothetical protein
MTSEVDISALKSLYLENKTNSIAFNIFKSRDKDSKETKLDRLEELIRNEGGAPSRVDVVALMKGLQQAGCGRFIVGRRGAPSRFEWTVSLRSVGLAATSGSDRVDQMEVDAEERDAADATDSRAEFDCGTASITHSFVLRRDYRVSLTLPVDLTSREATRLAEFLQTLPFGNAADAEH